MFVTVWRTHGISVLTLLESVLNCQDRTSEKKKLMNIKHSHGDVTPESHLPRRADSIVSLMLTLQIKKNMLPFFLVKLNHI